MEVCPIPPLSKEIYGFKVLELIMCLCVSHSNAYRIAKDINLKINYNPVFSH